MTELTRDFIFDRLPARAANTHKGSFGAVAVAAGSLAYRGAAALCVEAGGVTGETYVFNIYKDGSLYTQAAIAGSDSVTIYELPVGTYTIEEDTGWSWRSNAAYSDSAALSSTSTSGEITCTNSSNGKTQWLNGFSSIVSNIFGAKEGN